MEEEEDAKPPTTPSVPEPRNEKAPDHHVCGCPPCGSTIDKKPRYYYNGCYLGITTETKTSEDNCGDGRVVVGGEGCVHQASRYDLSPPRATQCFPLVTEFSPCRVETG